MADGSSNTRYLSGEDVQVGQTGLQTQTSQGVSRTQGVSKLTMMQSAGTRGHMSVAGTNPLSKGLVCGVLLLHEYSDLGISAEFTE